VEESWNDLKKSIDDIMETKKSKKMIWKKTKQKKRQQQITWLSKSDKTKTKKENELHKKAKQTNSIKDGQAYRKQKRAIQ